MTKKKTTKKAAPKKDAGVEVKRNGCVLTVPQDKLQGFLDAGWVSVG